MALKAGYKGIKKLLSPLKLSGLGELAIDQEELVADLDPVFYTRSEQAVSGVVNYLDPAGLKATASGSSVTATKQSDGSMALSGTASASSGIQLNQTAYVLPDGKWTFSLGRTIGCKVIGWAGGDTYQTLVDSDTGKATFTASSTYIGYYVQMKVVNGTAYSGYIYPMFSLYPDAPFAPYVMTNKQLTEYATETQLTPTGDMAGASADCDIRKVGPLVIGSLFVPSLTLTADTWKDIGTISAAPKHTTNFCMATVNGDIAVEAQINTSGEVRVRSHTGGALSLRGELVYVAGVAAANRSLPEATREAALTDVPETQEEVQVTKTTRKTTKKTTKVEEE